MSNIRLMRKFFQGLAATPLLSLALAPIAYAAGKEVKVCPEGAFNPLCGFEAKNFGEVIGRIVTLIFVVAIVLALFYLIYGGIKWLISEGDKTSVEAARQHIIAAVIGLIVIFLSYFILNIVIGFFVPGASLNNGLLLLPTISGN